MDVFGNVKFRHHDAFLIHWADHCTVHLALLLLALPVFFSNFYFHSFCPLNEKAKMS